MLFNNVMKLIHEPVGNNLTNRPEDVENVKFKFATIDRYKTPVENGYIDRELNDAILGFQRDKGLKVDGRMNPGGETEAALVGDILGFTDEDRNIPNPEPQKIAGLGALPGLFIRLAPVLRMAPLVAKDWWANQSTEERERALQKTKEEEARKAECDETYSENTQACNRVTQAKGERAGAICHQSASEIYASCLSGKEKEYWPPLQD
ncbi:MAG: peptidoglycan-binding protein [Alphaproteobacteria bacterium]|nr:peptidoglycan-binding protein [Alphaproteobacteria bacterium]